LYCSRYETHCSFVYRVKYNAFSLYTSQIYFFINIVMSQITKKNYTRKNFLFILFQGKSSNYTIWLIFPHKERKFDAYTLRFFLCLICVKTIYYYIRCLISFFFFSMIIVSEFFFPEWNRSKSKQKHKKITYTPIISGT
jgi:hypothetical protein